MTEADLNAMAEVRVKLPERRAGELTAAICDMGLAEEAQISIVPVKDESIGVGPIKFTESIPGEDGTVELVTEDCLRSFAINDAQEAQLEGRKRGGAIGPATRIFNTFARNIPQALGDGYMYSERHPEYGFVCTRGIHAEKIEEILEKLKDGTLDIFGIGEGSIVFLDRFVAAFKASREAQAGAVEGRLVDLGASALATQHHELEMRFGQPVE